jgi:hypothetical protein
MAGVAEAANPAFKAAWSQMRLAEAEQMSKVRVEAAQLELKARQAYNELVLRQAEVVVKANELLVKEERANRAAGCPAQELKLLELPRLSPYKEAARQDGSSPATSCTSEASPKNERQLGFPAC